MHKSQERYSNEELLKITGQAKPKKLTIITATYTISTPMFLGDANQEAREISASSVKGALRSWWRAWKWKDMLTASGGNETKALRKLHRAEAELFGSTAYTKASDAGEAVSKGKFSLLVQGRPPKLEQADLDRTYDLNEPNNVWAGYLLGLSLFENKKVADPRNPNREIRRNFFLRSAFDAGGLFELVCKCEDDATAAEISEVLLLWGLLGGLGSRSRKGLGSVSIKSLSNKNIPQNPDELQNELQRLLGEQLPAQEPPYTAFSQGSIIKISPVTTDKARNTTWEALCKLAKTMQLYRGWGFSYGGQKHQINRIDADHAAYSNKSADHEWVYKIAKQSGKPESERSLPQTLASNFAFGLPRSYGLSQREYELKFDPTAKKDNHNQRSRRASPLLIHLHRFPDGKVATIQSFLPAQFMPAQDVVDVQVKRNTGFKSIGSIPAPETMDWQVIHDYLKLSDFSDWTDVDLKGDKPK